MIKYPHAKPVSPKLWLAGSSVETAWVKNVPDLKADAQDCQCLRYLHTAGHLRGSFRPPETVCAVRSLLRPRDRRVKASCETTAKALVGNFRPEHLFTLRQSLDSSRRYQWLIEACDAEVRARLRMFASVIDPACHPMSRVITSYR